MKLKTSEKQSSSPAEVKLPFERVTASMVKSFDRCKKLFYYQYVINNGKGLRLPYKSIPLVFGGAFHKGVEAYYVGKDPVKEFVKYFVEDGIKDIEKPEVKKKFEENMIDGIRLMEAWKLEAPKIHKLYKISVKGQSEVEFKADWGLDIPVHGRYDYTTHINQILEFKTSKKPYKQDDVDKLDQASIYNESYEIITGNAPIEIFYIVFIKGRKKDPIQVLRTTRTKKQIKETRAKIQNLIDSVRTFKEKDYAYGEGFMHTYCDCKNYEEALLL